MIPILTITEAYEARVVLRALSAEWDRVQRGADRSDDRVLFELMVDVAVQAEEMGEDTTRYLSDTLFAIVTSELNYRKRMADDRTAYHYENKD